MTKFTVTLAFDVSCYANIEVEADTEEAAIAQAREDALDVSFTTEWDTARAGDGDAEAADENYRVVDVMRPDVGFGPVFDRLAGRK